MKNIYQSLLLVIAGATQKELANQIKYLKVENQILRDRLPESNAMPLTSGSGTQIETALATIHYKADACFARNHFLEREPPGLAYPVRKG